MKAAVWHGRKDVRIEEIPDPPPPPPRQVQVKVAWCGICGTDLHEYLAGPLYIPCGRPHPITGVQAPVVIGHEMSGTVTAIGEGVEGLAVGDRVVACPVIGCLRCEWCRSQLMGQCDKVAFLGTSWTGGGLAERLNLNAYQCYQLNDKIPDDIGALVEPFASTFRAVEQAQPGPHDNVAVVGAGPIGLMALMAARIRGAGRVIAVEVATRRIAAAKECGADAVIDPSHEDPEERAIEITEGHGFDVVFECAGQATTIMLAARLTRTRGRLVIMGVFEQPAAIDLNDVVFREKIISGSMSGYPLFDEAIAVMTDPRFRGDVLITDRIPLHELVNKGFDALLNERDKHVKILVKPWADAL